jgi:Ion channel
VLLLAIVTVFAVQGIATPGRWEDAIVAALLAATLVLALRVAEARPQILWTVSVFAVLLVVLSVVGTITGNQQGVAVRVANLLLVTLAPPAIAVGTVRTLRHRARVTVESVLGVLSLYLMIGMFFAAVYGLIGRVHGSFFTQDVATTTARCLYFSFTTLTTVGYGDFTASSNLGHTLAVSEALVGQIYLVTVVSLIVANLGRSRRRPDTGASSDTGSPD